MNKAGLKKSIGYRVQIRPPALDSQGRSVDADWIIQDVTDEYLSLQMTGYGYLAKLGLDHVYSFLSNPQRDTDQIRFGFLQLLVQITVRGTDVHIDPIPPPKAPIVDSMAIARRFGPLVLKTRSGERYFSWRGRDPVHLIREEEPPRHLGDIENALAEAIRVETDMTPRLSAPGRLRGEPVYELSSDFQARWKLAGGEIRGFGPLILTVFPKRRSGTG
jgi:hypothetical protein